MTAISPAFQRAQILNSTPNLHNSLTDWTTQYFYQTLCFCLDNVIIMPPRTSSLCQNSDHLFFSHRLFRQLRQCYSSIERL